jgi:uncharacterized protein YjbI with pentapeptide repeats
MANPEHIRILKEGVEAWNDWRKANPEIIPDLSGAELSGTRRGCIVQNFESSDDNLSYRDLSEADFNRANLSNAVLVGVSIKRLREACLEGAALPGAHLEHADLWTANLRGAMLWDAHMEGANLMHAQLEGASLWRACLQSADLFNSNIRQANFMGVNLEGARVASIHYNRKTKYRGIRVETAYGSQRFKRFAQDQDYLEELKANGRMGRLIYYIWLVFADCGRSFCPWAVWSLFFALSFAAGIYLMGPESFQVHSNLKWSPFTAFYYSIVTFTTLGFGDITPVTNCAAALIMGEVILGYIMIGGLISIMANKISKRS